ncbi:MAG: Crp/Fnr family transcriptional regulator [Clostridia bacterium]|nr:Crp/Fnr family transcriptional regulator [Clostridia bacterium]
MEQYFSILKQSPLFAGIEERDLSPMLGCLGAKERQYKKGSSIFSEGEPAVYIGLLCSGAAQIERIDYNGNRTIVSVVDSGELFAESFACAGVERLPISVTATEDCAVILLDCRRITQACCNACAFHQQMIYNLLKITAQKSIRLHQRAEIISHRTTRGKLMAYLTLQATQKSSTKFTIPFDRQELADYLEVDRSGLSAEISKLRKEGILTCRKSDFELL